MRSMLLIAASLLVASTAHAQFVPSDLTLESQFDTAFNSLNSDQRDLAMTAYQRYSQVLRITRSDGTRIQHGDPEMMPMIRIGVRCNISVVNSIRSGRINTVSGAVNTKFNCFRNGLGANSQTRGVVAYLTN